jgi:glutamate 5-kinase
LKFGDNDTLGAEVAQLCDADLLLILTGSDGLHGDGKRLPVVADPVEARRHVTGEKGRHSTGGMGSKLDAVVVAIGAGIETWILDGRRPGQMASAVSGGDVGTRFPARK